MSDKKSYMNQSNWIYKVQSNLYKGPLNKSIKWHQNQLKLLYKQRRYLQTEYDKLTGKLWIRSIQKIMALLATIIILALIILILFSGLITAIYLLPLWSLSLLTYILYKKYNKKY